jgi:hypothetical protein
MQQDVLEPSHVTVRGDEVHTVRLKLTAKLRRKHLLG